MKNEIRIALKHALSAKKHFLNGNDPAWWERGMAAQVRLINKLKSIDDSL